MSRIVQSIIGVVLLGVAGTAVITAVTSKGAVSLDWPLAAMVLSFATLGGFLVSKSMVLEVFKGLLALVKAWRKPD